MQKHRIYTNIGRDQKINVEINNSFDLMEVLSLKFSQKDIYASGKCSEYGVIVGRVSANSGFGIPNAKISIFVPLSDLDVNDPVISGLYPYQGVNDRNTDGYRYNLLPSRQQHGGHTPTGTFPDQQDILTREEVLEVFENYYSYTVKTNSSGDFMIWGVPIGTQIIHVDVDLSDIGCFSLRPYDFIKKGVGVDNFERFYKFKSSVDIDGLPQIVSFDKTIDVYPFWGNEELCEIGITRTDFDLSEKGIKIEPISLILMSSVTDDNGDAIKRSGKIRKKSGYKCNLQTTTGKIECVRYTGRSVYGSDGITRYPELEYLNLSEVIDENGVAMVVLPMNMEYTYTNEFGEEEITNDTNKGIPTTAVARFRFSLDFDSRKHAVGKYLVPNIREFNPNPSTGAYTDEEYNEGMLASYQFSDIFEEYITVTPPNGVIINSTNYGVSDKADKTALMLGTNNNGIPEDYFYKFIFGKVYTVSSFQGTHTESSQRDAFLGIKQIRPNVEEDCASKTNYVPTNFAFRNRTKFTLIISQILLFIQYAYSIILVKVAEILGGIFYDIGTFFYNFKFPWPLGWWHPFEKLSEKLLNLTYNIQSNFTQQLPLTIYPDCDECTNDDEHMVTGTSLNNEYCRVAEVRLTGHRTADPDPLSNYFLYFYTLDSDSAANFRNLTTDLSFLGDVGAEFEGEMARDPDALCVTGTTIDFNDLLSLSGETINIQNESNYSRYYAECYSITNTGNTSFSSFIGFFDLSGTTSYGNLPLTFNNGNITGAGASTYLPFYVSTQPFTVVNWNDITGMNIIDLELAGNPINYADMQMIVRIYDRACPKTSNIESSSMEIETGCRKYDKVYNDYIALKYLWSTGDEYGSVIDPTFPENGYPAGWEETITPDPGYNYLLSTIIGKRNTVRMPRYKSWKKIPSTTYDRKTKSGLSEFRDGIFTIIPVVQGGSYNTIAIQEWYRRKRVGLFFCGGVVNYSFIDNWLNGLLYFFKIEKRIRWDNEANYDLNQRGSKFPRELIFYNVFDKNFYYRSTPYNNGAFIGQLNLYDGFIEILHPTTFYDVGVRDEFLYEICTDPRVDPTCSVVRDITASSYQDPANVVEYAINYRLDITSAKFNIENFFSGSQYGSNMKIFDGDVTQLISINCEAGIEAFDLDSPHYYMYNGELMDPEDPYFETFFKDITGTLYGPTPIDLKFDYNGKFIRGCLNSRLGDYTQTVPFYLWDKGDGGFGPYGSTSDIQKWDRNAIASMPLQRIFSISGTTEDKTNYLMKDGLQEFLLKPMTINHPTFSYVGGTEDMLERFDVISYDAPLTYDPSFIEGDLWLEVLSGSLSNPQSGSIYIVINKMWVAVDDPLNPYTTYYFEGVRETFIPETVINYDGTKQVLSTPFLFYFGLRPEKTALDILIKYFGPKGAFLLSESIPCPNPGATPTPSSTPALSRLPLLTPTPTPTPTPSSGSVTYSYRGNLWACGGGVCGSFITNIAISNFQALSEGYFYKLPGGNQIIEITAPNPSGGGSDYTLWDGDRWPTCDGACSA